MSSKYGAQFEIPRGFPDVLKDFTREVLRSQPENIYDFAANYFAEKIAGASGGVVASQKDVQYTKEAVVEDQSNFSSDDFVTALRNMLEDASGNLVDAHVLKKAVTSVVRKFSLPPAFIYLLYSVATVSFDQVDKYKFLEDVGDIMTRREMFEGEFADFDEFVSQVGGKDLLILHGMSKIELVGLLASHLDLMDPERTNKIANEQLQEILSGVDLGLTDREAAALMIHAAAPVIASVGEQGVYVDYSPLLDADAVWDVLVTLAPVELLVVRESRAIDTLASVFTSADVDSSNQLHVDQIRAILDNQKIGLSRNQISALLALATDVKEDGRVSLPEFLESLSRSFEVLHSLDALRPSLDSEDPLVSADAAETFLRVVEELCPAVFAGEEAQAYLPFEEVRALVDQLADRTELTDLEARALLVAVPRQVNHNPQLGTPGQTLVLASEWAALTWPLVRLLRTSVHCFELAHLD